MLIRAACPSPHWHARTQELRHIMLRRDWSAVVMDDVAVINTAASTFDREEHGQGIWIGV